MIDKDAQLKTFEDCEAFVKGWMAEHTNRMALAVFESVRGGQDQFKYSVWFSGYPMNGKDYELHLEAKGRVTDF
jgi:hypothetical protein